MRRGGSSCIFLLLPVAFVLCTSPPFPQWGTILLILHAWSREKPSFWPWFSEAGEDQWNLDTYSRSFILSSYSSLTVGLWTWSVEKKQAPKIWLSLRKPEAGLEQTSTNRMRLNITFLMAPTTVLLCWKKPWPKNSVIKSLFSSSMSICWLKNWVLQSLLI